MTHMEADRLRDCPGGDGAHGWRFAFDAMACTFGLQIVHARQDYARQAAWAACAEIDRLEQLLSRFVPSSDISRLHSAQPGELVRVSPETLECLQLATQVHADTDGAFDIAFRSRRTLDPDVPPLVFDPAAHAIGVQVAGLMLDLGALGKGYAVDRAVAVLRDWGIRAALVDSGQSTVHALGHPCDAEAWRVGLRRPDQQNTLLGAIELRDQALGGSGQFLHGSHIIDPRTGNPVDSSTAAWAVAPTAALADALSTAFMVLSPTEVQAFCAQHPDISAILWSPAAQEGELICFSTQGGLVQRCTGAS